MLSVLIPVYNFDIRTLIQEIHHQASSLGIIFEIICMDDKSDERFISINEEISALEHLKYIKLNENVGRSAIRNKLAEMAQSGYLLFIDCDSAVVNDSFIKNYFEQLNPNRLIYGGRVYQPSHPEDPSLMLHWLYGSEREVISVERRRSDPYKSFQTNNFVIPRDVFLTVKLNEELKGYGHEDTLLGNDLKARRIDISHIDNPLCHIGLETAEDFLKKTDEGVCNLYFIITKKLKIDQIKLVKYYKFLDRTGLKRLFYFYYKRKKQAIHENLLSNKPSLRSFDLYKLGTLIEVSLRYKNCL